MERKISTKKYVLAFVLTIVVFSGGLLVGVLLEGARSNYTKQLALMEKVNLRSIQLQENYIDSGYADCKTLHKILEENLNDLGMNMAVVLDYQKRSFFNEDEFELQLQDYFLTEIQFYLVSKEIDKKCKPNSIKILYFYDEDKYETQGEILGYLKKKFKDKLLIFSLNSQFEEEPMIKVLLTSYNITEFPAIVIEDKVYQGHKDVESLMWDVCGLFKEMNLGIPDDCANYLESNEEKLMSNLQ